MSSEIPGDRPSDFSQPRPPDGAGYGAAPTARPRRNGMGTAALVIGVVALVLADALLEKTGGDSLPEVRRNLDAYLAALDRHHAGP